MSIASGDVPRIFTPAASSGARELERRLTAELHDHADRLLALHDLEHVFERERLEIQLVGDIEIGRDRLGIRVDHDRLEAALAQRQRGAHAAVVELHPLPDPIRSAAQDHDARRAAARRLALLVVAAVEVGRARRELAGAGVDHLVHGTNVELPAARAHGALALTAQRAELDVGESHPLHAAHRPGRRVGSESPAYHRSASTSSSISREEPGIDPRHVVDLVERNAALDRALHLEDPFRRRVAERVAERLLVLVGEAVVDRGARPTAQPGAPSRARAILSATPP